MTEYNNKSRQGTDHQNHYQQEFEEIQNPEPREIVVSLKKKQQPQLQNLQQSEQNHNHQRSYEHQENKQPTHLQTVAALQSQIQAKAQIINNLRKTLQEKKKEIKSINEEVDKQINNSIYRNNHRNSTPKNIKAIFHQPQSNNSKIRQLQQQLKRLRAQIKKTKDNNKKIEQSILDPLHTSTNEKAIEYETIIKEKMHQIQQYTTQRNILQQEMDRRNNQFPIEQTQATQKDTRKAKQQLAALTSKTRQQKVKLYELQKLDCITTQKMRFIKDITQSMNNNKKNHETIDESQKKEITQGMKNMSTQIRVTMEEKFKTEIQRAHTLKALKIQVQETEKKNWELLQLLRQIDSYLLKFYASRLKNPKSSTKKRQKESRIQRSELIVSKLQEELSNNDKNTQILIEPVFIEKRKTYEVGLTSTPQLSINLSDEFVGFKNRIVNIQILSNAKHIFAIRATYANDKEAQVKGYNMCSKIKPKQINCLSLSFKQQQYLSGFSVGLDALSLVKYLKIQTSQGKQITWGDEEQCLSVDQKALKKYQGIIMKGKLVQMGSTLGPNNLALGGLGFIIVYLSTK